MTIEIQTATVDIQLYKTGKNFTLSFTDDDGEEIQMFLLTPREFQSLEYAIGALLRANHFESSEAN